ncbi:hypothetical protein [Nocardia sp. CNY236]|uniref:hypothetical protein n=1 Tax=Nocardia sp. CNY236 TaxID=1169152 RepID=UPI00041DB8A0|nr:hypothetical protein [Nocardia sp. CNY236]
MRYSRWISRHARLAAGVLVAVALTACGSESLPAPSGSSGSTTTVSPTEPSATAAPDTTSGDAGPNNAEVSDTAATQLCDLIEPELSNWRIQGPTLGKIGLHTLLAEWVFRNSEVAPTIATDKAIIDRVTAQHCPDVRRQALEALKIPDLASGLVF